MKTQQYGQVCNEQKLLSDTQGSVVWHYSYDGNGSLIQSTPGESEASGAKRYTYSVAGFLIRVEDHDGTGWQNQAEMVYAMSIYTRKCTTNLQP